MNRLLLATALLVFSPLATASGIGTSKTTGVGVSGGSVAGGLSAKFYQAGGLALQGSVGSYTKGWGSTLFFSTDVVTAIAPPFEGEAGRLLLTVGGGGILVLQSTGKLSNVSLGINAVAGPVWQFADIPLEMTLDWRPTIVFGHYAGTYLWEYNLAIRYFY